MLSEVKLLRAPDLGWWAYVPVQFDGMKLAQDMGITPGTKGALVSRATLFADAPYGTLYPGPSSITIYEGRVIEPKKRPQPPKLGGERPD
jgi:hypothetical protein